jgi:hypothetical protein
MYTMQVLMPGDDVPKFIAWTAPHRNPPVLDPTVVWGMSATPTPRAGMCDFFCNQSLIWCRKFPKPFNNPWPMIKDDVGAPRSKRLLLKTTKRGCELVCDRLFVWRVPNIIRLWVKTVVGSPNRVFKLFFLQLWLGGKQEALENMSSFPSWVFCSFILWVLNKWFWKKCI